MYQRHNILACSSHLLCAEHAARLWGDHHRGMELLLGEERGTDARRGDVHDGDTEEALDLGAVEVDGDDIIHAHRLQHLSEHVSAKQGT